MSRPPEPLNENTPIYDAMLEEREGRAPGDLVDYLSAPWEERRRRVTVTPPGAPAQAVRAVYRVDPVPPVPGGPQGRVRPYAKEFLAYGPEETGTMLLPHTVEG